MASAPRRCWPAAAMPPPITRRNSVEGIADMNEFARTVVITTLQSEGGSCPLWKLAETADQFQCDNLVQALRSMKNKKQVAYAPPMLMLEMHKMEIVTLVSDGAEEDDDRNGTEQCVSNHFMQSTCQSTRRARPMAHNNMGI